MTGPERRGAWIALAGLLALTAARRLWPRPHVAPSVLQSGGTWIETGGAVDRPGVRRYAGSVSIARAARDAGVRCVPNRAGRLEGGRRLSISPGGCAVRVTTLPARVRLVLGIPLDPNLDTAPDLERLPGIGRRLAEGIVRGRPYRSIDDLERVHGIGPKTVERLRPLLEVTGPTGASRAARP